MENQNHNGGDNGSQQFSIAFIPSFILHKEGSDILIFVNQQKCSSFVNKRSALIEQGNRLEELSGPDFENWLGKIQSLAVRFGVNCLTRNQRALLIAATGEMHYENPEPTPLQIAIAEGCNRAVQQKVLGLCRCGMPQVIAEELVEEHLGTDWQIPIATLLTAGFPQGVIGRMENVVSASLVGVRL